jgi:type I restriction enzyme S subunit
LENGIGFGSTEFHVIRSCSHLLPLFIFYHVFSHNFREKGKLNMTGSAGQKRIGKSFIQNYLFPLPPLAEQQKIAEILGSVDRKIDILESKREKVVDQKKGLMQKLLTGEKRLPYKE